MHCQYNIDCDAVKHAQCSENVCACKQNYLEVNKTLCGPILGGFCTTDEPCVVKNAVCIDNKCQCNRDFTPLANTYCIFGKFFVEHVNAAGMNVFFCSRV